MTVHAVVAALVVDTAPMPWRATPLIMSKRPPMYSVELSGLSRIASTWRGCTETRHVRSAAVWASNAATRGRDWPATVLKLPAMYTVVAVATIDRTAPLAPPVNELTRAPVVALSTAKRFFATPLTAVKSPPT